MTLYCNQITQNVVCNAKTNVSFIYTGGQILNRFCLSKLRKYNFKKGFFFFVKPSLRLRALLLFFITVIIIIIISNVTVLLLLLSLLLITLLKISTLCFSLFLSSFLVDL